MNFSVRRLAAAATLVAAVGAAAPVAATTAPAPHTGSDDGAESGVGPASAFPVTVETTFGPVTIESPPERIVVLDFAYADALLALGIEPTVASVGNFPDDVPWLDGLLDPSVIDNSLLDNRTLNLEAVAAAEPDLILGGWWAVDDAAFAQLSAIAPTVPGASGGNDGWEVRLDLAAQAVGRPDGVEAIRADVAEAYATVADANPQLEGATYTYTGFGLDQGGFFWGNGTWLEPFGLVADDDQDNTQTAAGVSLENLDLLDGEVWAIYPVSEADRQTLTDDPRFALQPAVADDLVVWLDLPLANATNNAGPLSVIWAVETIAPVLAAGAPNLDD